MYASSTKQKVMSRTSFEAKLNSLREVIPQVMGTRRFVEARGYFVGAIKVWQDNMPTIAFVMKGKSNHIRLSISLSGIFLSKRRLIKAKSMWSIHRRYRC